MGKRVRMLIWRVAPVVAVLATLWMGAAPAAAKTCYKNIVPPGRSGTSQYVEVVPTACGSATPPSAGGKNSGSGGSIGRLGQGAAGVKRLSQLGSQGQAAAALAAAGAPAVARASTGGASRTTGSGQPGAGADFGSLPSASGSSGGALSDALAGSSGSGLGSLLPVLMCILLAAAVGTGVVRARRGRGPSV